MIYILIEQQGNVINSVEAEFITRFHKSSIVQFGDEKISESQCTRFSNPPIFDVGWLIICSQVSTKILKLLRPDKNTILIKITRKSKLQATIEHLGDSQYSVIDNYHVDKQIVIDWVCGKLNVTKQLAVYLYNRAAGSLKDIESAVRVLSNLETVHRNDITNTVQKRNSVSISDLVEYMLGVSERANYNDIMQFIYDFRNASKWLKESIIKELQIYQLVYSMMDQGVLTLKNYLDVIQQSENKNLKNVSQYRMKRIISHHDYISLELVAYSITLLNTYSNKNCLCGITNLLKVGGNLQDVYDV